MVIFFSDPAVFAATLFCFCLYFLGFFEGFLKVFDFFEILLHFFMKFFRYFLNFLKTKNFRARQWQDTGVLEEKHAPRKTPPAPPISRFTPPSAAEPKEPLSLHQSQAAEVIPRRKEKFRDARLRFRDRSLDQISADYRASMHESMRIDKQFER